MATIFCSSGGSNTSPYDTWAKAATSLQTAITAASNGDTVVLQYNAVPSGDAGLSADVTYTFDADCILLSASNDGGSSYTPTAMGVDSWVGTSGTGYGITITGADLAPLIWGLTFRVSGTASKSISIGAASGFNGCFDSCYFWEGTTSSLGAVQLATSEGAYVKYVNCTFRFGATNQSLTNFRGNADVIGGSISSAGSAPTYLNNHGGVGRTTFTGVDLSHVTGYLIKDAAFSSSFVFDRCKLGSGVVILASQTSNPTMGSCSALLLDCSSDGTSGIFGFYNALGQVYTNSSIYFTSNNTGNISWKIDTTANASYLTPFVTPPIDVYHSGTSEITPYLEILREGNATALTDAQVWGLFGSKVTASSSKATYYEDKQSLTAFAAGTAGTAQTTGAGNGSWTGESATYWSGKLASTFTPAVAGPLTVQVCVGLASLSNLYVHPEILGRS